MHTSFIIELADNTLSTRDNPVGTGEPLGMPPVLGEEYQSIKPVWLNKHDFDHALKFGDPHTAFLMAAQLVPYVDVIITSHHWEETDDVAATLNSPAIYFQCPGTYRPVPIEEANKIWEQEGKV